MSSKIKVLFLSANPKTPGQLQTDEELRATYDALSEGERELSIKIGDVRNHVQFDQLISLTPTGLTAAPMTAEQQADFAALDMAEDDNLFASTAGAEIKKTGPASKEQATIELAALKEAVEQSPQVSTSHRPGVLGTLSLLQDSVAHNELSSAEVEQCVAALRTLLAATPIFLPDLDTLANTLHNLAS